MFASLFIDNPSVTVARVFVVTLPTYAIAGLQELGVLPASVTAQVAESLRRYIADVDDKYLVIGEQPEFEDLLTAIDQEAAGCVFYSRPPLITSPSLHAPK